MTKTFQTHPLDLHEIRSRIASSLGVKDLASCARVSQDWSDSFTPPLYNSVVLSDHGPSRECIKRNKHLIKHLKIHWSAYKNLTAAEEDELISSVMANSTPTTLNLRDNSIENNRGQALAEALTTNSTLASLDLDSNSIGPNGAQALAEAVKTISTLTTLNLSCNATGDDGAQALSEALKTFESSGGKSIIESAICSVDYKKISSHTSLLALLFPSPFPD